jgi:hypothetical protein
MDRNLVKVTASLWEIFHETVHNLDGEPITLVFDALDECNHVDLRELIRELKRLFPTKSTRIPSIKVLLTSRPY